MHTTNYSLINRAFLLVKSLFTYTAWLVSSLIFGSIALLVSYLPNRYDRRLYFYITSIWNSILVRSTLVPFKVYGRENIQKYPGTPSIFVFNHTSAIDIPLAEMLVSTYPHVWASKKLYGRLPILGPLLKRMHVLVDRENPSKAARSLSKLLKIAKGRNNHVVLFPEGTRSRDGKLLPFTSGFATLAKKLGRPVVPVHIKGLDKVLLRDQYLINSNVLPVEITIGRSIMIADGESIEDFTSRVEGWFLTFQ